MKNITKNKKVIILLITLTTLLTLVTATALLISSYKKNSGQKLDNEIVEKEDEKEDRTPTSEGTFQDLLTTYFEYHDEYERGKKFNEKFDQFIRNYPTCEVEHVRINKWTDLYIKPNSTSIYYIDDACAFDITEFATREYPYISLHTEKESLNYLKQETVSSKTFLATIAETKLNSDGVLKTSTARIGLYDFNTGKFETIGSFESTRFHYSIENIQHLHSNIAFTKDEGNPLSNVNRFDEIQFQVSNHTFSYPNIDKGYQEKDISELCKEGQIGFWKLNLNSKEVKKIMSSPICDESVIFTE